MITNIEVRYKFIDKKEWGPGKWDDEYDKIQWTDKETGYICLLVRHPDLGHWCVYVGLQWSHACFYMEREPINNLLLDSGLVHEITYCNFGDKECPLHISHLEDKIIPTRRWWVGIDFAHGNHVTPAFNDPDIKKQLGSRYIDENEATEICLKLAQCLKKLEIKK